jgi:hypothetical protein
MRSSTFQSTFQKEEQMVMSTRQREVKGRESGFALVVALLSLLLLTFLGLTLATTTSTELQIANNYRWSRQAYYNAEAGLEITKRFLRNQTVWSILVPPARAYGQTGVLPTWTLARADINGVASRNFENRDCDTVAIAGNSAGGQGYGVVLDFGTFAFPYQNMTTFVTGNSIPGTATVWLRRPPEFDPAGQGTRDYQKDDQLVVTVEGTAPFVNAAAGTTYAFQNRAVRVIETVLLKSDPNDCENLSGQAGNGPTGSGFDPCSQIGAKGVPGAAGEPAAVAGQN